MRNNFARKRPTVYGLNRVLAIVSPTEQQADFCTKPRDLLALPKYKGDRVRLKAWKNSVNIKLTSDIANIPNTKNKLAYLYNLLEGKAMDQIQPYILAAGIDLSNIATLLTIRD